MHRLLIALIVLSLLVSCQREYTIEDLVPFPPDTTKPFTQLEISSNNGGLLQKMTILEPEETDSLQMNLTYDAKKNLIGINLHYKKTPNPKEDQLSGFLVIKRDADGVVEKISIISRDLEDGVITEKSETVFEYDKTTRQYIRAVKTGTIEQAIVKDTTFYTYSGGNIVEMKTNSYYQGISPHSLLLRLNYDANGNIVKKSQELSEIGAAEIEKNDFIYTYGTKRNALESDVFLLMLADGFLLPGKNNLEQITAVSNGVTFNNIFTATFNQYNKPSTLKIKYWDDADHSFGYTFYYEKE